MVRCGIASDAAVGWGATPTSPLSSMATMLRVASAHKLRRSFLQRAQLQLLHRHDCLHDALRFRCIAGCKQLDQLYRHHLPGHAEAILQPATLLSGRVAALGKSIPVVVYLILRAAVHHQGDSGVELEHW